MRHGRFVERLIACLIMRVAQTWLRSMHALAGRHDLIVPHYHDFVILLSGTDWTSVSRHSQLHKQQAEQHNEYCDQARWTRKLH